MKTKSFFLVAALIFASIGTHAQSILLKAKPQSKQQTHAVKVDIGTLPASGTIIYTTPSLGVTPFVIQHGSTGWQSTATITPEVSYGIGIGGYTKSADGTSIDVQPYVSLNAFAGAGISLSGNITASVPVGGILGIYKWVGIGGGVDAITGKPLLFASAKFDVFNFKQGAGASMLKLF